MPRRIVTVKPKAKPSTGRKKSSRVSAAPEGMSEASKRMREVARAKIFRAIDPPIDAGAAVMDTLRWIPKTDRVTVFMSGGIDSHLCLFACLKLGLNVNIASFTLDTHESTDYKAAKHAAEVFGLEFIPIKLDTSERHIKKWVLFAVNKLGQKTKASIECAWPLYMGIRAVAGKTKHVVFGLGGDSYFLMAKSQSMHCKDLVAETRRKSFRRNLEQNNIVRREAFRRGMYAHLPYFEDGRMYAELEPATDFYEINRPQKSFFNLAFPDMRKKCKVKAHQNFQLGDTNISGVFSQVLLASDWNKRNLRSVVGIYNDVVAGKLKL